MARQVVFDDWKSWIHFILGFAAAVIASIPSLVATAIALAIVIPFIVYESLEREKGLNKLGDFIEFLTGFATGYVCRCVYLSSCPSS